VNKNLITFVLILVVVAGIIFFVVNKNSKTEFGVDLKLQLEEPVTFTDGLKATLKEVNDHRCSGDVVCFWEGEVSFLLEFSGGQLSEPGAVSISSKLTKSQTIEDYTVSFRDFSIKGKSVAETSVTILVEYKKP
jgi:putative hemolysin